MYILNRLTYHWYRITLYDKPSAYTNLKNSLHTFNSSLHIPSRLTLPVKNVNSPLLLVYTFTYPYLFRYLSPKGLNQNWPWLTHDCKTQLTHITQSRTFSPKYPIIHIKKNSPLIIIKNFQPLFKLWLADSLFSKVSWQVSLTFLRGLWVGWIHSFFILTCFIIQLNRIPDNFQLSVRLSSWTTSLCLHLDLMII